MSRRTKIVLWSVVGVCTLILALPIYIYISTEREFHISQLSHWPHVPPPELFVRVQPKEADVVGFYEMKSQTVTTNGLAAMGGKVCELELRADGTFSVTNYPRWLPLNASSEPPHITEWITTTGTWCCAETHIIYNNQRCWGVIFSNSVASVETLALRSQGAPYDLMWTYGDGDEEMVVKFGRVARER